MQDLQQVACRQNGYAIITSKVLVDKDGEPVYWIQPQLERIEPRKSSRDFISQLLCMLEPSNNS